MRDWISNYPTSKLPNHSIDEHLKSSAGSYSKKVKKVLILGAAGRDFHNFNVVFRGNPEHNVVGFTATQIPGIANRRYPSELAGQLYPAGIPIFEEKDLESLIETHESTPLGHLIKLNKPSLRVTYEIEDLTHPGLAEILAQFTRERAGVGV
jgi:predicted GTPase